MDKMSWEKKVLMSRFTYCVINYLFEGGAAYLVN
jgi:hypothetical protein